MPDMVTACRPLRETGGLPPRRSELIQAAAAAEARASSSTDWGSSINVPLARDRMFEYFEREQLPGDVKATLAAALQGDLHLQHLLFMAMIDSWPKLQKNLAEVARLVSIAPWKVHPHAKRGEKPDEKAEEFAGEIEDLIWGMKPDVTRMEDGFEGTIRYFSLAYFLGHGVSEIRWTRGKDGTWMPKSTKQVPARFYGYPYDAATLDDPEDRLMFDPTGMTGGRTFQDFPENRFLVGINRGHHGHPATASPLRALAAYWLAAVYGLKWFINFTQLYGIPWRHAEVPDEQDKNAVKAALGNIGTTGYIVTNPGAKINILSPGSTSGASLPQRELIDLADKQCDQFILGQTLTSGTDDSGSRALGEVHQDTKNGVIDAVADFVGSILTHQLVPAVAALNWGDSAEDLPEIWAKREESKDLKANAERMEIVKRIGVPMSKAYVYEELGIPVPADDDELFQPAANGSPEGDLANVAPNGDPGDPETPGKAPGHETKANGMEKTPEMMERNMPRTKVAAADAQPLTVDQLSDAVLEGLTGVSREWLSPVRPVFERLAALAMAKQVTDEDFLAALEKAQRELPEIFDLLDSQALEEAMMNAISSAALAGSVSRYKKS